LTFDERVALHRVERLCNVTLVILHGLVSPERQDLGVDGSGVALEPREHLLVV